MNDNVSAILNGADKIPCDPESLITSGYVSPQKDLTSNSEGVVYDKRNAMTMSNLVEESHQLTDLA
jgi:hypothetical protein